MAYLNIRRVRLGRKLAKLRKHAGLSQVQVAEKFNGNQTTFARYERGERAPQRTMLRQLLELYDVPEEEREEVMTLYRLAERPSWWYPYRDLIRPEYAALIDLESDASEIRTYESLVPGLLQTPDYARQICQHGPQEIDSAEVERRLELRLVRQEILSSPDHPRLVALMDEGALRRVVGGPKVMREQIAHLMRVAEQARTTIQIVPYTVGATPGASGSFTLIDCEGTRVVYTDTIVGEMYLENRPEVKIASQAFERLLGFALSTNDSAALMRQYMEEYA
ncbi:helix-turn-helix domain-containing protein [Allosalinactinospora lopnorensis]|uniref:helix-turn-helix domain-containing protein n=1 Tax=Allosalinactinospora lopnorensis TaxID=1352348 RepID=UPI000696E666|nr:helix-turn-helix transcriptional regulator [Allosalinactinospora lopnorensis]